MTLDGLWEVIACLLAMHVWWAYCGPLVCLLAKAAYEACACCQAGGQRGCRTGRASTAAAPAASAS